MKMNKNKLFITEKDSYLDKVTQEKSELRLLVAADGVEVMSQTIEAGVMFRVTPASKSNVVEFFYVLEGELVLQSETHEEDKSLKAGDSYYAQNLDRNYIFKTITRCRFLYVSSDPIFHIIGEGMRDMHKLNAELEAADVYTKGHSNRVYNYALGIANEFGLTRDEELKIAMGALFHDIGKTKVPVELLSKQDPLTEEEYEIMKQHPIKSAEIIKDNKYEDVSNIVIQHHERVDGSGYPYGLKGDEILLGAKIIAVADAFDAMTTDRPYRKGLSDEDAVVEIKAYTGFWFDQEVVEALMKYIKKRAN